MADLDTAQDTVKDAELEVELYRRREENRTLTAPFAGVLLMPPSTSPANTQTVIVGQQIGEGNQIAELLDMSRVRLTLDLPEPNLRRRALGQLESLDDRMLRDIGLSRGELTFAKAEPLYRDPTLRLVRGRGEPSRGRQHSDVCRLGRRALDAGGGAEETARGQADAVRAH